MIPVPSVQPAHRRAFAMVRVSMEGDETTSPAVQRHAIETHAAAHRITIVDWIEGVDGQKYSGSRRKSAWWPKLSATIDRIEAGEAEDILVWKFSRTGRQRLRWAIAVDRMDVIGGQIISATEPIETRTASGKLARGMLGEVNAYQADLIGEVWKETHERRVRNGLPPTGGDRFGYQRVRDHDDAPWRLVPDPVTGPLLADLYRWYLGGMGSAQLTRRLNDTTDRRWTYQGVMKMLDSGFGAGLLGRTVAKGDRRIVPVPWEREYAQGVHEPVIDTATWEAYIARRMERHRKPTRAARTYLLTGLVRCGECGGPMSGKTFDGRPTYVCSRSTTTNVTRRVTMVAWRVDKVVEQWLFKLAEVDSRADAAEAARRKSRRSRSVASDLKQQIVRQDERLVKLGALLADEAIPLDEYRVIAGDIREKRVALERRLQMAVPNPVEQAAPAQVPVDIEQLWPRMTPEERQMVLRPLIRSVVIHPAPHRGSVEREVAVTATWE